MAAVRVKADSAARIWRGSQEAVVGSSWTWLTTTACSGPVRLSSPTLRLFAEPGSQGASFVSWVMYLLFAPCPQHLLASGIHVVFLLFLVLLSLRKLSNRFLFKKQAAGGRAGKEVSSNLYFRATVSLTVIVGVCYTVAAIWRVLASIRNDWEPPFDALYSAYLGVQALAWIAFAVTVAHEKHFGALVHSFSLRVWWSINFIPSVLAVVSLAFRLFVGAENQGPITLEVDDGFVAATFPITAFLFVVALRGYTGISVRGGANGLVEPLLHGHVENGKESRLKESGVVQPAPESYYAEAGVISRALWLWLGPVLEQGSKTTLQLQDVPLLAPEDRAELLYALVQSRWPKELGQSTVGRILFQCFWKRLLFNGALMLIRVSVMYVGPILITQFVNYVAGTREHLYEGYLLVLVLLAAKCTEVLTSHQYNFSSQRLGMVIRSSMITTVYRKGLRLSSSGRQAHGVGQIVNYMSVDVQQLSDSILQLHNLWALPLQVIVAVVILFQVVGVSMVAGLVTMIGFVAISISGSRRQRACQTHVMKERDTRMRATSEVLNYMKIIKLQAWEEHFRKKVEACRESEYGWLVKFMQTTGQNVFFLWISASVVSVVTFTCAALIGFELTPAAVFTATATFRILQEPVRSFPQALIAISQALVSLDRLDKYMQSEELDTGAVRKVPEGAEFAVSVEEGSFAWEEDAEVPTLSDIDIHIRPGSLVAIVGMVGSGKSSLLSSFLGEMPKLAGKVTISGSMAYVPQTPWIQNGTIEDNILFGQPMNRVKYVQTLRVCALERDLELMEFGDQTEIGERGINLSGGQKQRIQLARAVYQESDVYLLDDIFSAVDAHTGSALFKDCIGGVLSGKTIVLVTHQVEFLHNADQILVMRDGRIVQSGKYNDLLEGGTDFDALVQAHNQAMDSVDADRGNSLTNLEDKQDSEIMAKIKSAIVETSFSEGSASPPVGSPKGDGSQAVSIFKTSNRKVSLERKRGNAEQPAPAKKGTAKLIDEERRESGNVGWPVYWMYFTTAYGWVAVVGLLLCQFIWQALLILSDYWLAYETAEDREATFQPKRFILGYLYLAIGVWVCVLIRTILVLAMGLKASQSLYGSMLRAVFRAPMSFFDTTPAGRILSRSSSDQSTVDVFLHLFCGGALAVYCMAIGTLFVICQVTWQVILVLIPLAFVYFSYQVYFLATSRELTRIDSITKAPVIHHFSESIAGFAVIRCFQKEREFSQVNVDRVDSNLRMDFHNNAANEWLGYRLEMIGTIVLCTSALLLVALPPGFVDSELVGLSLSYGLALNTCLYWTVWLACTVENKMVCVERIKQFSSIPSEAPLVIEGAEPSPDWPHQGNIRFVNLQLRYRPNTPLVLKGVSLSIRGGEKVGVVGRTGSGKSTLLQAVFRIVEPAGGQVIIDGLDIATLGLTDLRSRLGIIPQEPTLFEGTIRSNIDPLGQYEDQQIWEALRKCQLESIVRDKPEKLDSAVLDNGENWSVGQRQLFCLGRVLLKRSRILFLDEATASVDSQTDGVIQKAVREEFNDCTVISIAHRIPTVMDSDNVLVLDAGKVTEYDSPAALLQQPTSLFAALVKEYSARASAL